MHNRDSFQIIFFYRYFGYIRLFTTLGKVHGIFAGPTSAIPNNSLHTFVDSTLSIFFFFGYYSDAVKIFH